MGAPQHEYSLPRCDYCGDLYGDPSRQNPGKIKSVHNCGRYWVCLDCQKERYERKS